MPRFMVIVKANAETEQGTLPTREELAEMGAFNEELLKAGVLRDMAGLRDSSLGARIRYDGRNRPTVTDGPFAETKELVAGFWVIETRSKQEAIDWMTRAPFREGEIEIRQLFEDEDFGDAATPELHEQDRRIREQAAALQNR